VLLNIECSKEVLEEINTAFRFNDAVIRNLILGRKGPEAGDSPIMKLERESREKKERDDTSNEATESRDDKIETEVQLNQDVATEDDLVVQDGEE
jgi:small subunit ribosomal protein S6